jgi:hypothetical protein
MNDKVEGLPLINQMGVDGAAGNPRLNKAVRLQLEHVRDELSHYLADPEQMPHEWGSLDSLDDMRNSMWVATAFMDELLWTDNEEEYMRWVIAQRGMCAIPKEVEQLAFPDMDDDAIEAEVDRILAEEEGS